MSWKDKMKNAPLHLEPVILSPQKSLDADLFFVVADASNIRGFVERFSYHTGPTCRRLQQLRRHDQGVGPKLRVTVMAASQAVCHAVCHAVCSL